MADRFMKALQSFESGGHVDQPIGLFHEDAECVNLVRVERGQDGVRKFWADDRRAFGTVRSRFTATVVGGAALEWESEHTLPADAPIRYRGVSILEVADGLSAGFAPTTTRPRFSPPQPQRPGETWRITPW